MILKNLKNPFHKIFLTRIILSKNENFKSTHKRIYIQLHFPNFNVNFFLNGQKT